MRRIFATLVLLLALAPLAKAQPDKDAEKTFLETAQEVLEANIDVTGGRLAWEAVQSIQLTGTRISDSPMGGGKMTATYVESIRYPGYLHNASEMDTPMGAMTVTRVRTPDASWVEAGPMGRRDIPIRASLTLESACPELTIRENPEFEATGMTSESFEGNDVYVVSHNAGGRTLKRYYHQDSLLLIAAERIPAAGPQDSEPELVKYADYREVDGVLISHAQEEQVTMTMISRSGDGQETETTHRGDSAVTIENIVVNVDIGDALFADD